MDELGKISLLDNSIERNAILTAAFHGKFKDLEELLETDGRDEDICTHVLLQVLPKLKSSCDENSNYRKCYDVLMRHVGKHSINIDVNFKDKHDNHPLYYAAKFGTTDIILQLLERGAALGDENEKGFLSVEDIDFNTLKKHFDSCVLRHEGDDIYYDYSTLFASKKPAVSSDCDLIPETKTALVIGKSSELRALLEHPLLTYFLYEKWYRIRWIYYINLFFYLVFYLSVAANLIQDYLEVAENRLISLLLVSTTTLLLTRELFQLFVGIRVYISNFENHLELLLISLIYYKLLKYTKGTEVNAFICLLATGGLLFMVGKHPKFITNIVMLRTVSWNFFSFFIFYFILIFAFSFSFYILFNNTHVPTMRDDANNNTSESNSTENKTFPNALTALFRTIIMLTGEFNSGDLAFHAHPVWSHIVFLVFVVLIAIILLNLVTGLAISDTQQIKNDAELIGHIAMTEYVFQTEAVVFNRVIKKVLKLERLAQRISLFPREEVKYKKYISCLYESEKFLKKSIVRKTLLLVQDIGEEGKREVEKDNVRKIQEDVAHIKELNYDLNVNLRKLLELHSSAGEEGNPST